MLHAARHRARCSLAPAALLAMAGLAPAASLTGIGDLAGGAFHSAALDLSADGTKVCGTSFPAPGASVAFRWTSAGGLTPIPALPAATMMNALGIASSGNVVVGDGNSSSIGQWEAYRWDPVNGTQSLGAMAGHPSTTARAASATGIVIVGHGTEDTSEETHAFRWTSLNGMLSLGALPGYSGSAAHGVSSDGIVTVGYSYKPGVTQAMRHTTSAGMVGLGFLPGNADRSVANDTSADGAVIVGVASRAGVDEAFRWTAGVGMVGLGTLGGGTETTAARVSWDGAVVIGDVYSPQSGYQAAVWDHAHGWRTVAAVLESGGVDTSAWTLTNAYGVSADGSVIVGYGGTAGHAEGWVAVIGPPCTGDTNGDDVINFADLNTVLSQFGQSGPLPPPTPGYRAGDVNNDGLVSFSDLNAVLSAFGRAC